MNITQIKNTFIDDSFSYEGIFKELKTYYNIFFISIQTEVNQKFSLKAAQQANNLANKTLSLKIANYQFEQFFRIGDYTAKK